MYTVSLFDIVMAWIGVVILVAFTGTLVYSIMKVKVETIEKLFKGDNEWLCTYTRKLSAELVSATAWRDAVINLCIINHISWDETNPEATLAFLLLVEQNMALDPAISKKAAALITKAKREHGKKIRKAADRKLERTEREYEQRLEGMRISLTSMQQSNSALRANMGEIRAELSAFQGIVSQELDNFVRLPSVRNKMLAAINQQHQAWKDL